SYAGLIRSFVRCIGPSGCQGGGGTITMQVVRGYLLTPEQTIIRKIKEIFLALELEGKVEKEEIFELYVNRIFLGNRSYGIEAAANTYFNKNLSELSISESATIAAIAQLPSRINPVKNLRRTLQRRDWILSRMFLLDHITEEEYLEAISDDIEIAKNINLYDVDAKHLAEHVRQEVISRYGLRAYKEGWSVYTTIDSQSQNSSVASVLKELFLYDKRHGWRKPDNYGNLFSNEQKRLLENSDINFLYDSSYFRDIDLDEDNLSNKLGKIFDSYAFYMTHIKALVINVTSEKITFINEDFDLGSITWREEYDWAREQISINELGPKPSSFNQILSFGDLIYLKVNDDSYIFDQIPNEIEARTGASIDWIFDLEGEEGFRKRESEMLEEMVKKNSIVLSTGGGIILSKLNRELLSSRGTVFYLSTPISTQVERTSKDKDRPLLKNGNAGEILTKLHNERKDFYETVSDHIIDTENKSSQEVASEIIKVVKI
ncbi:transglycosylase domain-containing protein, partial [Gammaproteobacteria bacterium]|nr:transglycosylase domain-containing protein [Gammaproteobacteria bacterium]